MPSFQDDLYLGSAFTAAGLPGNAGAAGPIIGIGPLGRIYVFDVVPATKATNNVLAAQAVAAAGNATINGALAASGVATLDCARSLQMVSTNAGDTTQTVTVYGTDVFGRVTSQVKTLNGTTIVNFTKAFKTVTRVAVSAALAGNLSMGTTDVLGLPVAVTNAGYVGTVKWNATLAQDAGTFVAADATTATTATNDPRGTYTPSSACDGSKRLVMGILLPAIACGPNATELGAIGVTPA